METNLYSCIRTGRTISEKTMEDGNLTGIRDEKIAATSLANLYGERPPKLTANGHDFGGESSSPGRPPANAVLDDKNRKRINPLRIHLGKRPFVDNSIQYYNPNKKRKLFVNKHNDSSAPTNTPRVPKLIPKRIHYQNTASHVENNVIDHEQNKPVPRLVPKSQLSHYKKGKVEKEPQLKEYAESLGLQPMVKFKCRKCCSMSFKTLAMLKEHQKICRAQAKEPAHSPEAPANVAGSDANTSGPNRVTRKVYLCSACGTYYENWNLFLHMREIHNRHICLFCLGMFSKAEKLSTHLTNKHNVKEFNYESKEDFFNVYNGTLYLMCCVCDEICSEQDDFFNHDCNNIKPKPVPVLVSKNAAKSNIVKSSSNSSELSVNGPPSVVKDYSKSVSDKKDIKEGKLEMLPSQILKPVMETKTPDIISSTSMNTDTSAALLKEVNNAEDSGMELEGSDRPTSSPVNWHSYSADKNNIKNTFSNGDENADHTDDSDSHISDGNESPLRDPLPAKPIDKPCLPIEKEKETGGIKLKLSLNNANSPVIINSTVDPTIGQIHHKPTRSRRPPKRYEKVPQLPVPEPVLQPKTPSIKMTICDRADSPFVKTTIYEDNKVETTIKSILNNNSESHTPEHKPESAIKTTIYDNKPEDDDNTLNRVPKLTVRVPKELLDKDSSSDYSSDSDMSEKLTVDENNVTIEENREPKEEVETECAPTETFNQLVEEDVKDEPEPEPDVENVSVIGEQMDFKTEVKTEPPETEMKPEPVVEEPSLPVTELALNRPLDKYPMKELLRVFLASTVYSCIYCNHVRKIAVNCEQLSLHMVAQHRFSATVDSITAEELMPETITAKLQVGAQELASVYMNLDSYDSEEKNENISYEHIFECFQCFFKTAIHKDLCLHNRKMHQKTILLCVMCKTNFLSYSELLCHVCPGTYDSEYEMKFRCCLCNVDQIPSQFRLMVHLRKIHHTCDVCLEFCHNQARLSNHVWKHKLHHMCYRCGIAYRNKLDINNHLFWKHGTESVLCKKCMQKKWPHVYHFCSPPAVFACDECNLQFTKAVCLKVHKRIHSEEFPHQCTEEDCTEKFVSKKLLNKHVNEHRKKLLIEELKEAKPSIEPAPDATKESIPTIDLVDENPSVEAGTSIVKDEPGSEQQCKKNKKKKLKDKDALLLDVNLPALNLSESDSSDESDSEVPPPPLSPPTTTITTKEEIPEDKPKIDTDEQPAKSEPPVTSAADVVPPVNDDEAPPVKAEHKLEPVEEEKPNEQQVLDIWDNFKKYQAKVEKQKTPPLVPIKKHVCESDHDYCLIPTDMNGDNDVYGLDRKKNKKSPRRRRGGRGGGGLSSSSSSSSDSDSSCSCGSNCSCSSSSGSSSSSSSDSDSSDESGNEKKKPKRIKRTLPDRRISTGSNVDVMGMSETPVLVPPQVTEPPIAESDLETEESDTDEEFYDENPQSFANKLHEEKLNQLMQGPPAEPPDAPDAPDGDVAEPEAADLPVTPVKEEEPVKEEPKPEPEFLDKPASAKKKSKKKKKSKSSKKHGPIKINIPKDVIGKSESEAPPALVPNKITISLHSNTVQLPETPKAPPAVANSGSSASTLSERKRASKRRRVPNKFYGYSSDEEGPPQTPTTMAALKPQQPPKLEWRKEDLPSPMPHKAKKEVPAAPSTPLSSKLSLSLSAVRLTAPVPDPEPPRLLMNSELESNESDSSSESGAQPAPPFPPPTYLTTGTSSLPYAFQRPAARAAREGESVYCYCRCPYDEVSEMIACDAEGCPIEWFHFECVGIMVPPKGKWYCPECRKNQIFSGYR